MFGWFLFIWVFVYVCAHGCCVCVACVVVRVYVCVFARACDFMRSCVFVYVCKTVFIFVVFVCVFVVC